MPYGNRNYGTAFYGEVIPPDSAFQADAFQLNAFQITQVVRPTSTSAAGAWTAQLSGTLHGVTADETDATYAQLLDGDDPSTMILALGTVAAPGAGVGMVAIRTRMV